MALTIKNTTKPQKRKSNGAGQARVLSSAELESLIGLMDNRWTTIFSLCYLMGSRVSEVLGLEAEDIGDELITLRPSDTKTKTTRQIAITDDIREVLDSYQRMPKSGLLFEGGKRGMGTGKPISRASAHKALDKVATKLLGPDHGVSTHSFRRSFATHLKEAGWQIANIQDVLGHTDVMTTARYIG